MRKHRKLIRAAAAGWCALLIGAALPAANAQDEKNTWPEGSAMHTGLLYGENRDHFAKRLDAKVEELKVLLVKDVQDPNERLVGAIVAQHRGWLRYRDEECEMLGALTGAGGSWPSAWATKCAADLTHRRYVTVSRAIRCIRRLPADMQYDRPRCLYQLSPLTTGK